MRYLLLPSPRRRTAERLVSRLLPLIALALGLASTNSVADLVRYTYTGSALTTTPGIGYDSSFTTVGTAPAGLGNLTFSMLGDLGVGRSFGQFAPAMWSISDGVHSYSSATPPPHLNFYAKFATDITGAITDWYVQVSTYSDPPSSDPYNDWDDILLRTSTDSLSLPVPYDESRLFSAVSGDYGRSNDYHALSYDQRGTWTMTAVDGGLAVPEPTTLALVGAALTGVVVARSRRSAPMTRRSPPSPALS